VYGTEPNAFLVSVADRIPPGRVLSLGEGEGRNGVFLAMRGFDVVGVDGSAVGLAKARCLAAERGVSLVTVVADLADWEIETGQWSGIVSIFCHIPPSTRSHLYRAAVHGLKPGGAFVLEAYTPDQLGRGTGGPPTAELLVTLSELREELAGLDLVVARETEREVHEGRLHTGTGAVVQVVGIKPGDGR